MLLLSSRQLQILGQSQLQQAYGLSRLSSALERLGFSRYQPESSFPAALSDAPGTGGPTVYTSRAHAVPTPLRVEKVLAQRLG